MKISKELGVVILMLSPCLTSAQQNEPAWQEGVIVKLEAVLFEGNHIDKPGHVSVFRATGCTYVKKCGWVVTIEIQQTDKKLVLQKKIQIHNRIASMHYEDVNVREGDHVRLRQGNEKDSYVVLDRDEKPHDFTVMQVVQTASSVEPSPVAVASTPQANGPASHGSLGVTCANWEDGGVRGAQIVNLSENSSAQLGGLHKGDVITKINDTEVASVEDLESILASMEPGTRVNVVYLVKTNLWWAPKNVVAILAKQE